MAGNGLAGASIILSLVATSLAAATFYRSFVYTHDQAHVIATNWEFGEPRFKLTFAVINSGTTDLAIMAIEPMIWIPSDSHIFSKWPGWVGAGLLAPHSKVDKELHRNYEAVPLPLYESSVLKPSEVRAFRIDSLVGEPFALVKFVYGENAVAQRRRLTFGAKIQVVTGTGARSTKTFPIIALNFQVDPATRASHYERALFTDSVNLLSPGSIDIR